MIGSLSAAVFGVCVMQEWEGLELQPCPLGQAVHLLSLGNEVALGVSGVIEHIFSMQRACWSQCTASPFKNI